MKVNESSYTARQTYVYPKHEISSKPEKIVRHSTTTRQISSSLRVHFMHLSQITLKMSRGKA
jgi:hypothetical protein